MGVCLQVEHWAWAYRQSQQVEYLNNLYDFTGNTDSYIVYFINTHKHSEL